MRARSTAASSYRQVALAVLLTPLEHREVLEIRLVLIERNALTLCFRPQSMLASGGVGQRLPPCIVMLS